MSSSVPPESQVRHNNAFFNGITVLQCMLRFGRSLGVTEIARELGLSKSSAHDLLGSLVNMGFVDKNEDTRRYSLSPAIFTFFGSFSRRFGHNSQLAEILRRTANELDASLYVSVLCRERTYVVCASGPLGDTVVIGSNAPWYASSCGKALVSLLERERWPEMLPHPEAERPTEKATLDHTELLRQLEEARERGCGWNHEESAAGLHSVAAPIPLRGRQSDRAVAIVMSSAAFAALEAGDIEKKAKELAAELGEAMLG